MRSFWLSLCVISLCAISASAQIVVENFEDWDGLGTIMPDPEDNAGNSVLALGANEVVEIEIPGEVGIVRVDVYDFGETVESGSSAYGPRWGIGGVDSGDNPLSVAAGLIGRSYLDPAQGYAMSYEDSQVGAWYSPTFFGGPRQCTVETWNGSVDLNNGSGRWTTWIFEAKDDGTASISAEFSGGVTTPKTTWHDGTTMQMSGMNKLWISGGRLTPTVGPVASGTYAGKTVLVDNITFEGDMGVPNLMIGDADGNGKVDIFDFLILKSNYGSSPATWYEGDFNNDDSVDIFDFLLLKANYGKTRFDTTPAFEDNFDPGWVASANDWRVATWEQNGTLMAKARCAEDGQGHIVQTVLAGGPPFYGGSMQMSKDYKYGRWVTRLRPSPVPGVLNSMFLKDWENFETTTPNDGLHTEIDYELLTYTFGPGRGKVHIALHLPGATNYFYDDVELGFNPSDDYHEWAFEVYPDRVVWYVDDTKLAQCMLPEGHTLDIGFEMFYNSWTKEDWIHGPPAQNAYYYLDWVKYYPLNQ